MNSKNDINWWQQKAEELRLQLHLGSKEAAEAYEKQKKEMANWAAELRNKLEQSKDKSSEQLRQSLEELELQAALAKADGEDALKAQQARFENTLKKVEAEVNSYAGKADTAFDEFAEKAEAKFENWRMRMEVFHLQLHLGAKEASEEWEGMQLKAEQKLQKISSTIENAKKEGEAGWNNLKTEVKRSWDDIKSIFN